MRLAHSCRRGLLGPAVDGRAPISLLMKLPIGIMVAVAGAWLVPPDWCIKGMAYLHGRVFL